MRKLTRLLLFGLLATAAVAQQGTWTLYYADNETLNQDGSITVTPQVWISGDDGGYCAPLYGMFGYDVPAVLLNGNPWQVGDLTISGGQSGFGDPVQFYYTFPDVTIPNDGTTVDLSYAGKVQGICWGRSDDERSMWAGSIPNIYAFFTANFVDGTAPTTSPGLASSTGFPPRGVRCPGRSCMLRFRPAVDIAICTASRWGRLLQGPRHVAPCRSLPRRSPRLATEPPSTTPRSL